MRFQRVFRPRGQNHAGARGRHVARDLKTDAAGFARATSAVLPTSEKVFTILRL